MSAGIDVLPAVALKMIVLSRFLVIFLSIWFPTGRYNFSQIMIFYFLPISHHQQETNASLTADPGVASSTLAWSHTFVKIDHVIISTVILLPSVESFKDCCQVQAKVCARSTG